ncbi:MAG: hypothetical protein JJU21_04830 [Salinarimonas sp.]|nr:hypothetical protein [Salinarimonas sp.]
MQPDFMSAVLVVLRVFPKKGDYVEIATTIGHLYHHDDFGFRPIHSRFLRADYDDGSDSISRHLHETDVFLDNLFVDVSSRQALIVDRAGRNVANFLRIGELD